MFGYHRFISTGKISLLLSLFRFYLFFPFPIRSEEPIWKITISTGQSANKITHAHTIKYALRYTGFTPVRYFRCSERSAVPYRRLTFRLPAQSSFHRFRPDVQFLQTAAADFRRSLTRYERKPYNIILYKMPTECVKHEHYEF